MSIQTVLCIGCINIQAAEFKRIFLTILYGKKLTKFHMHENLFICVDIMTMNFTKNILFIPFKLFIW